MDECLDERTLPRNGVARARWAPDEDTELYTTIPLIEFTAWTPLEPMTTGF